jgi:sugar phosphate permease
VGIQLATVPPTFKLAGAPFGKEKVGLVFEWIFAAHQIGAAVAVYGAGLTRTLLLTSTPDLYAAGGACMVAAIIMTIRHPAPAGGTAAVAYIDTSRA